MTKSKREASKGTPETLLEAGQVKRGTVPLLDAEMAPAELALAQYLDVDLSAPVPVQLAHLAGDAEQEMRATVRMGLRLMAIKAGCKHGEFEQVVDDAGISADKRKRSMRLAKAIAAAGDERRVQTLLGLGQAKALSLLAAEPEIVQQIEQDPVLLREALDSTRREFERKLKELGEQNDRLQVRVKTQEDLAQARLAAADRVVVPGLPVAMQDVRREVAALHTKAQLSVQDLGDLAEPLAQAGLAQGGEVWLRPTAHQVLVALRALAAQAGLLATTWAEQFGLDVGAQLPGAADRVHYMAEELGLVQTHMATIQATHADEAVRRQNRAHNAKGGRGAPRKHV